MTQKRPDRRVLRTRQMLREAFLVLLKEKGFDALSVQEITDRANLGRATFYLHYRDKSELLEECMEALAADFISRMRGFPPDQWDITDLAPLIAIFSYAREQSDLYRVVMSGQAGLVASRRLHVLIAEHTRYNWEKKMEREHILLTVPLDFLCNYFAGSLLALVFWWLESGIPYPEDQMAEMFRELFITGQAKVLGNRSGK